MAKEIKMRYEMGRVIEALGEGCHAAVKAAVHDLLSKLDNKSMAEMFEAQIAVEITLPKEQPPQTQGESSHER
ncbi:hypothetical protein LCGC14_0552260 [marine sediment metagenome]|uniref:Uncharacterized protein n=1 Tax=marine sediment metagenome TaxID=412755 RepID=A0A0F9UXR0_9ZZZZ